MFLEGGTHRLQIIQSSNYNWYFTLPFNKLRTQYRVYLFCYRGLNKGISNIGTWDIKIINCSYSEEDSYGVSWHDWGIHWGNRRISWVAVSYETGLIRQVKFHLKHYMTMNILVSLGYRLSFFKICKRWVNSSHFLVSGVSPKPVIIFFVKLKHVFHWGRDLDSKFMHMLHIKHFILANYEIPLLQSTGNPPYKRRFCLNATGSSIFRTLQRIAIF